MLKISRRLLFLFDNKQRILLGANILLMILGALLETLGIAMMLPLLTLMLDDDFYMTNRYAKWFCAILNISSARTFMFAVIFCMIGIYIFKNIFLFFECYMQQNFVCMNRVRIQKKILNIIIKRKYEYFLNESTGNIMRIISDDVSGTFVLLNHVITLCMESIICVIIFFMVLKINIWMSVAVCIVLIGELTGISIFVKPSMNKLGKASRGATMDTYQWIMQIVSGIKEIKVSNRETFFLKKYEQRARVTAKTNRNSTILSSIPKLMIESVTISAMLLVLAVLLVWGIDMEAFLPQLAVFAMAAIKILPSVNRISIARNGISYYESHLTTVYTVLATIDPEMEEEKEILQSLSFKCNCQLINISYAYPNSDEFVLNDVNLDIPVGSSVGLVGTSGGGKTTTVDILLGLLSPQSGEVLVDGQNIKKNYLGWLKHISYIPQMIFLLDDTICANVAFGILPEEIDYDMVWEALEEASLKEFVLSLPDGIDTVVGERGIRLSGGQRQRIGIARALYSNPELLIFDEATSALDNETETAVMESIDALHGKKTMIIIAHRLTTIDNCDIVYRVESGNITREK